jgi:hypothetical protein
LTKKKKKNSWKISVEDQAVSSKRLTVSYEIQVSLPHILINASGYLILLTKAGGIKQPLIEQDCKVREEYPAPG